MSRLGEVLAKAHAVVSSRGHRVAPPPAASSAFGPGSGFASSSTVPAAEWALNSLPAGAYSHGPTISFENSDRLKPSAHAMAALRTTEVVLAEHTRFKASGDASVETII
eukprot:2754969-Prymnesium_polylepis.1